jgi:hypothetical protein
MAKQHEPGARRFGFCCALGAAATLTALAVGMETFAASGSATATATIIEPVAITTSGDLVFSASGANMARVVILSAYGNGGGMSSAPSDAAAASPASVTISGDGSTSYAVTVPSTLTATDRGGTQSVTVASSIADGGASGRSQTVLIGGLLVAGLTQTQGRYAGTLTVTIEYN